MRKFALVILDSSDVIIDRYNLDIVSEPQGLGFALSMSTITGNIRDIITAVTQSKNVIKFNINQIFNSYAKSTTLINFIQKYSGIDSTMALEYTADGVVKYCEGRVTALTKTEINTAKNLIQGLDFTQLEPFFIKRDTTITIRPSNEGKKYPYTYPYSYGTSIGANNTIENLYIAEIPIIITINGAIENPKITLRNTETNEDYNIVEFEDYTLLEGEKIIINSAQQKIIKIDADGNETDFTPEVNPAEDLFLLAESGTSKILVNSNNAGSGFELTGGWREYTL